MPGYLYRRPGPATAPWNPARMGGTAPDAGTTPPPVSPTLPHRQSTPLRACAAAFVLLLSSTPRDAGSSPIPAAQPDRAPATRRVAPSAYLIATGTPRDSGVVVGAWPITDTFTAATSTLLSAHAPDTGGTWTLHPSYSGTAQVDAANRLRQTNTTASCYYADATPTSADYSVSADANELTGGAFTSSAGVCGRLDVAADTCYSARMQQGGGDWVLVKRVAGSETSLGTSVTPSIVTATPFRLSLEMSGTTIRLVVDGVVKVTATDSAISAAGKAGVRFTAISAAPADSTLIHLDNFATADIQTPVFPPQPVPDRASGPRRAASSAYLVATGTPRDAGSLPVLPETPDLARGGARAASSAYLVALDPPADAGDVAIPAASPDRAAGPSRAASSAYLIAAPPAPEIVGFIGPRGGRARSRYLYRLPVEPGPYGLIVAPPPDSGAAVQEPVMVQVIPDRATSSRRSSASAYAIATGTPRDAGVVAQDTAIPAAYPHSAPGPRRGQTPTYPTSGTPRDAGSLPVPTACPDRAPASRRAASSAYLVATGTPGDSGVAAIDPPIGPDCPDIATGPRRAGRTAYNSLLSTTPRDAGDVACPPEAPDLARGPRRAASSAYLVATGTPADAGDIPIPTADPDRASGPRRAASHAYTVVVPSPVDAGVIFVAAAIQAEYPDIAAGPRRAGRTAYNSLLSASPRDAGSPSFPASMPWRADRPRPAGNAAYRIITGTPPDQGAVPGPIRPQYPDRAPGRRRTSPEAYLVVVPSPVDAGVLSGYRIYANTGAGDPINYASPVSSTPLLTWTSGVLAFPGTWKFGVRAYDGVSGLEERNVDAVVRLILDGTGADITAIPDAPTGLSGHAAAAGAIVLDWTYALVDGTRAPTGFHVYSGTGGVVSYASAVATVAYTRGVIHFTATVAGGSDGVAYTFGVRAYNATGEEPNVATTTITASASAPAAVLTFTGAATS